MVVQGVERSRISNVEIWLPSMPALVGMAGNGSCWDQNRSQCKPTDHAMLHLPALPAQAELEAARKVAATREEELVKEVARLKEEVGLHSQPCSVTTHGLHASCFAACPCRCAHTCRC